MTRSNELHLKIRDAQIDCRRLAERFADAVGRFDVARPKIAVLGDFCLDKYLYLYPELDEKSVETGLTARQVRATRLFAGVGGTIANNLRALGADVRCYGVVGEDGEGFDLLRALEKIGADASRMVVSPQVLTGTYMKPMRPDVSLGSEAEDDAPTSAFPLRPLPGGGAWIECERFDIRNPQRAPKSATDELVRRFEQDVDEFDAVVVSDQFPEGSEALFSGEFRAWIGELAARKDNVFFLADSRFFADSYRNTLVKCNASELFDSRDASLGKTERRETTLDSANESDAKTTELATLAAEFAKRNGRPVLVTRGENGSALVEIANDAEAIATLVPAIKVPPPIDICGAGDATNAGLAFARALGFDLVEAAFLAGVVSSITIRQLGVTGTASPKQVMTVLQSRFE